MDSQLVLIWFDLADDADEAAATLRSLDAQGFVSIEHGAILSRDAQGTVTVKPMELQERARDATLGGAVGLLAGGLLGLPVLGLLAGGGIGARHAQHGERLDELVDSIGEKMSAGSTVIAVQVSAVDDPDIVRDRLSVHDDAIASMEVPAELRAHIDEQRVKRSR